MNDNIMKKFCDIFNLRHSDLITTLTYVLMDNFSYIMQNFIKDYKAIILIKNKVAGKE